jgi:AraC-like DNA-binding protein
MRGIAHMSNDGLQDLVLVSSNDSPTRFRETLARVSAVQELSVLVEKLQPWLRSLPATLAQILVDALRRPHAYASAEDIAAASGMTVSGLYRSFRGARMSSPKSYVVGARAFRGYLYLRDVGFSVRDIAAKLGYTHPRIFAHQIECVLGDRPSKIRRSLEIEACVQKLVTWFSAREETSDDLCFPSHLMDDSVLTSSPVAAIGQLPSLHERDYSTI